MNSISVMGALAEMKRMVALMQEVNSAEFLEADRRKEVMF